jgi:ABC-type multidrug transport system fused ATPase/permease subunit
VDKIMVLADGRIVEYGPREVLAGDVSSRYHSLLEISADHAPEFSLDERMEGLRE